MNERNDCIFSRRKCDLAGIQLCAKIERFV